VYYGNKILIFLIIGLIIMALLSRKNIVPRKFSMNFVYAFTFIDGILMYPLQQYYIADLGKGVFQTILVATIVLFTILAYISNRSEAGHYLKLEYILFAGLIGLLISSILNLFLGGDLLSILISIVGVVIFSGYVLYDISLIKYEIQNGELKEKNDLSIHVLNLYLDFINLLLDILNIFSFFLDD
jgi:FtsH-binding integral membrane protein